MRGVEGSVLQPIDHYANIDWPTALQRRQIAMIELLGSTLDASEGTVLDIGCGDGFFLSELDRLASLSARGWTLHGVDYSSAALEAARARPYEFRRCNLEERIPYPDDTFGVVTAGEVLEHIYDPDRLLREIRRVLRPGGHLALTTPNLQAWYNRALFVAGIQPIFYESSTKSSEIGAGPLVRFKLSPDPVGHVRVFNRRALVDLLQSEGFRVLTVRGSTFDRLPGLISRADCSFARFPSLASNLVALAAVV